MGNVASVIHVVNIRSLMLGKKKKKSAPLGLQRKYVKKICTLFFFSTAKYCMRIIILPCALCSCTALYETQNLWRK